MLRELSCRNYKAFEDGTSFPLAPLTVITGPNNVGKSSVLDLVRLMSTGGVALHGLNLPADNSRLRSFQTLLSNTKKESLEISFRVGADVKLELGSHSPTFRLADDISIGAEFATFGEGHFLKQRDVALHPYDVPDSTEDRRIYSDAYELGSLQEENVSPARTYDEFLDALGELSTLLQPGGTPESVPEELWIGLPEDENDDHVHLEAPERRFSKETIFSPPSGPYRREVTRTIKLEKCLIELGFSVADAIRRYVKDEAPIDLSVGSITTKRIGSARVNSESDVPRLQNSYAVEDVIIENLDREFIGEDLAWLPSDMEDVWLSVRRLVLGPLVDKIEKAATIQSTYLPSFRANPKRYYGPQDQLTPLLQSYQNAHPIRKESVEEWLDTFEIGADLQVEVVATDLYSATINRNGARRHLADLGSGTAQLLPLILKLTASSTSDVLLLEEPEANLHPNLQARLADLFIELIEEGHQVLVETHSEYLVRRLQYLVATGECTPDDTSVLYIGDFEPAENETPEVRAISIDQHGQLSRPFGGGFFDQSTDLMVDLFKYGSEN
jgi:predicted ATPase